MMVFFRLIKRKILIVGEFASTPRNQGGGSSFVNLIELKTLLSEINNYTSNYQYLRGYSLNNEAENEGLLKEVLAVASSYDKVLIMSGLPDAYETEGVDRSSIDLPKSHLRLIEEIAKVNKNVIVNLYCGGAVAMPFVDNIKGIINSHLLGFDSGTALLDILFGNVSPSGRLAYTNPIKIEDNISTKNFANSNNAVYYVKAFMLAIDTI